MPPVTGEQILKEVADLRTQMADDTKTVGERIAGAEELAKQAVEDLKEFRKQQLAPGSPVPDDIRMVQSQRGGMFRGPLRVPYSRMLQAMPSDADIRPHDREQLSDLQTMHTAMVIRYDYLKRHKPDIAGPDWMVRELQKAPEWPAFANAYVDAGYARAANDIMNPAGGEGVNLEFTLLTGQLLEYVRLATTVAPQFREVTLPRHKTEFPVLRGDTKAKLGGTSLPATNADNVAGAPLSAYRLTADFGKIAFDCKHCLGFLMYNDDMVEDSVVPIVPVLTEQTAIMIARATDAAIINGDLTGTHMDSDVTAADDFRKAWYGLRKLSQNNEASIGAAITVPDIQTMEFKLGKFAQRPQELVLFLSIKEWLKLMQDDKVRLVLNAGVDLATLRTGVISNLFGIDIVVTEEIRRDLNASGDFDNTTTTKTIEILCNRTRFWIGRTRDVRTETVRAPQALTNWVQADVRLDFQPIDKESTDTIFAAGDAPVCVGINVTS